MLDKINKFANPVSITVALIGLAIAILALPQIQCKFFSNGCGIIKREDVIKHIKDGKQFKVTFDAGYVSDNGTIKGGRPYKIQYLINYEENGNSHTGFIAYGYNKYYSNKMKAKGADWCNKPPENVLRGGVDIQSGEFSIWGATYRVVKDLKVYSDQNEHVGSLEILNTKESLAGKCSNHINN